MSMEEALILTPSEVGHIRAYVRQKFAGLPQERHAEIVADAMRRIVMKQLPGYDETRRAQITDRLIRAIVLEQRRPVSSADILHACLLPEWKRPDLLQPLHRWAERRLNRELPLEAFTEGVEKHVQRQPGTAEAPPLQAGDAYLLWEWLEMTSAAPSGASRKAAGTASPEELPHATGAAPLVPHGRSRLLRLAYGALSAVLLGALTLTLYGQQAGGGGTASPAAAPSAAAVAGEGAVKTAALPPNELPPELQYREIDRDKLAAYLRGRGSLLAEARYMDAIVTEAERHNIHPLLLFAITGQEQGFVPADAEQAETIANNPFNVYHSWQAFNTTIGHSARIAANTIVNLSRDRPADKDPIEWINRKYAEDPHWHVGVSKLFRALSKAAERTGEPAAAASSNGP